LTSIPNNRFHYIEKYSCIWLNPDNYRLSTLLKIQRKCKKYIQRRQEIILNSLIDYLPREVILYVVM